MCFVCLFGFLTLCVFPLFECVFACRGSGNLQLKQMVGMLYEIAIDKEYKTQRS